MTNMQKITLASSRDIPFHNLVLSQSNVRRVKAGISVDELAESIARRGLIQSLHVRPVIGEDGAETGKFEVPAGGRRYRALELLVKQKRLAKSAPVPCIVSAADDGVLIDEVSLAENIERAPLHPLDQFRAFQAMREKGMTEEAIAAAFFVDAKVVKQRLRLVTVAPVLLEVYAADEMTLEQLMAFTVSSDHARQAQVWEAVKNSWSKEPYQIRRMLTEGAVRASDKRARFLGLDAYEAAGGFVLRDLFQQDDGGWLQDPVVLERLVGEKLKAEAAVIVGEGWKWIEVAVGFPYGHTMGLRELLGTTVDLTDAERATREVLRDEYDRLEAEYSEAEDLPEEVDQRLGEIERQLSAFDSRPMAFDPVEVGRAGAFVSIDSDGSLLVERGFVRPEDEARAEPLGDASDSGPDETGSTDPSISERHAPVISTAGHTPPQEDDEDEGDQRPFSLGRFSQGADEGGPQGREKSARDMGRDIGTEIVDQFLRLLSAEAFHFRIMITGISEVGAVKRQVDVFGKSPDRIICLGKRGPALEDKRGGLALRQGKDAPQGPADPEVFLDDCVGDTPRGGAFPKQCGPFGCRKEGDLIHEGRPIRDRQSTEALRASRQALELRSC